VQESWQLRRNGADGRGALRNNAALHREVVKEKIILDLSVSNEKLEVRALYTGPTAHHRPPPSPTSAFDTFPVALTPPSDAPASEAYERSRPLSATRLLRRAHVYWVVAKATVSKGSRGAPSTG
jgi:hypothetical protein